MNNPLLILWIAFSFATIGICFVIYLFRQEVRDGFIALHNQKKPLNEDDLNAPALEIHKSWEQDGCVIGGLTLRAIGKNSKEVKENFEFLLEKNYEHDKRLLEDHNNNKQRDRCIG